MSGVLTKKFGRMYVRGLVGELGEVLLELPLRGAPGEVRVGLVEADRGSACIIAGRVNASARKSTSGSVG